MMPRPEVVFIGGRAGVGKTSVAAELHAQLTGDRVRHCVIEGDNLDLAWPVPWERGLRLAELNLSAMWSTYRAAGYSRLIYTNSAAVRADVLSSLLEALGGNPVVHAVLLTSTDDTAASRLDRREIGTARKAHLERGRRAAKDLELAAPEWVQRINTDGRDVIEVARTIRQHLGWRQLAADQR